MADPTYQTKFYEKQGGDGVVLQSGGTIELNGGVVITTDDAGHAIFSNLPVADPHVVGALWDNSGVLTVSAG